MKEKIGCILCKQYFGTSVFEHKCPMRNNAQSSAKTEVSKRMCVKLVHFL
jgi:hypothetical protein